MKDSLANPHDQFFKELLSRQETARDFLTHYLPSEVAALFDFTAIEISKDSFVDKELKSHFSDILYKVNLQDGREAYVYVLFEHKSYPEPLIAFQLLRYMVRVWEQSLKQDQPLKPILPLVVYHGRTKWKIPLTFKELFDAPEAIATFIPDYHYCLCDLTQYSDEEIKGEVILQVGLLLFKYIFQEDLSQRLPKILTLLQELAKQRTGLEYLETVLRYLSSGTDKITKEELTKAVNEIFFEGGVLMPTIAERWIEQGIEQGIERGIETGIERGIERGIETGIERGAQTQRETILRILLVRFDLSSPQMGPLTQQLKAVKDLSTLQELAYRALEDFTLTDFKARLSDAVDAAEAQRSKIE